VLAIENQLEISPLIDCWVEASFGPSVLGLTIFICIHWQQQHFKSLGK